MQVWRTHDLPAQENRFLDDMDFRSLTQRVDGAQRSRRDYNYRFHRYLYRYSHPTPRIKRPSDFLNRVKFTLTSSTRETRLIDQLSAYYRACENRHAFASYFASLIRSTYLRTHLASTSGTLHRYGCGWACPWNKTATGRAFCSPPTCPRGPRRRRRGPANSPLPRATDWRGDGSLRWGTHTKRRIKAWTTALIGSIFR